MFSWYVPFPFTCHKYRRLRFMVLTAFDHVSSWNHVKIFKNKYRTFSSYIKMCRSIIFNLAVVKESYVLFRRRSQTTLHFDSASGIVYSSLCPKFIGIIYHTIVFSATSTTTFVFFSPQRWSSY